MAAAVIQAAVRIWRVLVVRKPWVRIQSHGTPVVNRRPTLWAVVPAASASSVKIEGIDIPVSNVLRVAHRLKTNHIRLR